MSAYEIVSTALAAIAIIVSIFALWKSATASNDTLKLNQGMNELEIKNMVTSTKQRVQDITLQMLPLSSKTARSDEENTMLEGYKLALKAAMEDNVNAYEEACAKYLDGKVDKIRFRKTYNLELRRLITDPHHNEFFDPIRSPYKAILKVYDEWENLER
jgi:hypothetical protein